MKLGKDNELYGVYFAHLGRGYVAYIQDNKIAGEYKVLSYCERKRYYWCSHLRSLPQLPQEFPTLTSWAEYCRKIGKRKIEVIF